MSLADPNYIIALGASAGGMEEINSFFDNTPLDGVSYIIIQHLSSDFKSRMVELLAKHSKLQVREAKNEMAVRCNEVYLIPHNKYMTIQNGKLYLDDKDKSHTAHLTINRFFTSLADNSGERAIGIIFSGLGSDGTEGIKAIKNAGGMVMARNPENSEFGSMPSHAIATGLIDFILEPELMPNAIEDYIQYGTELSSNNKNDQKDLAGIIDFIKEKSPLDFTDYKQTTILRRTKIIAQRFEIIACRPSFSPPKYCRLLVIRKIKRRLFLNKFNYSGQVLLIIFMVGRKFSPVLNVIFNRIRHQFGF